MEGLEGNGMKLVEESLVCSRTFFLSSYSKFSM